eukprot:12428122-Karenia_brevis.AAC.1
MESGLEPRDTWLGIKELKQQFTPKKHERAQWDDDKKMCNKKDQAEQTALFLERNSNGGITYMK